MATLELARGPPQWSRASLAAEEVPPPLLTPVCPAGAEGRPEGRAGKANVGPPPPLWGFRQEQRQGGRGRGAAS